ncbi:protein of unknown function [Xenorhabdus doucetiae]|uniref:Uncharacterized protein n=1 Tax=Xenorhabdus doucetiae TaxID=351671 RepID=A0A068QPC0_9GAMM|nr:protein of unknown function [Xenorhabdus doucetiae]
MNSATHLGCLFSYNAMISHHRHIHSENDLIKFIELHYM